jgi:hypothetical protein
MIQVSRTKKTVIASQRSREWAPDDRLREAIHLAARKKEWIASSLRSSQ